MKDIKKQNIEYARSFRKIGSRNLKTSQRMFWNRRFPESIYYLQQSVECNTKAFSAIYCENEFKPKSVSHESMNLFKVFKQDMDSTLNSIDDASYEVLKSKMSSIMSLISWIFLRGRPVEADIQCAIKSGDLKYLINFASDKIWKAHNLKNKTEFGKSLIRNDRSETDVLMDLKTLSSTLKVISVLGFCFRFLSLYPIAKILKIQNTASSKLFIFILKIVTCSLNLSILLDGHYESCRYPFFKDGELTSPIGYYNKQHPLVKHYRKIRKCAKLLDKSVKLEQKLHLKHPEITYHLKLSSTEFTSQQ